MQCASDYGAKTLRNPPPSHKQRPPLHPIACDGSSTALPAQSAGFTGIDVNQAGGDERFIDLAALLPALFPLHNIADINMAHSNWAISHVYVSGNDLYSSL